MAKAADADVVSPSNTIPTSHTSELSLVQRSAKGKGRAGGGRHPGPLRAAVDARNKNANPPYISNRSPKVALIGDQGIPPTHGMAQAQSVTYSSIFDPSSPASSVLSRFSSPPVVLRTGYRKRHLEPVAGSDDGNDSRTLKRLRRRSMLGPKVDQDVISLFTDDEDDGASHEEPRKLDGDVIDLFTDVEDDSDSFIIDDGDLPSSPPPAVRDIRERIRGAIRQLTGDPSAMEKSRAQLDALIAVMTESSDLVITMKTGGGKSMLWVVPHKLDEDAKSIVVCPFVALLNEQYEKTTAFGLRCHNFGNKNVMVPDNVQVLFMQVEHCASERFTT